MHVARMFVEADPAVPQFRCGLALVDRFIHRTHKPLRLVLQTRARPAHLCVQLGRRVGEETALPGGRPVRCRWQNTHIHRLEASLILLDHIVQQESQAFCGERTENHAAAQLHAHFGRMPLPGVFHTEHRHDFFTRAGDVSDPASSNFTAGPVGTMDCKTASGFGSMQFHLDTVAQAAVAAISSAHPALEARRPRD